MENNFSWFDNFIFVSADESADQTETDSTEETSSDIPLEDTSDTTTDESDVDETTNEENPDDQPNADLAEDIANGTDEMPIEEAPNVDTDTNVDLQTQIEDLKKQIEGLQKDEDLEDKIETINKRLNNLQVPDDADLNDEIFQSSSSKIKLLKRAMRRISMSIKSSLSGEQQTKIIEELKQNPEMTCQEVAAKIHDDIKANEQDIIDFIRNSEFRFRHRHFHEASSPIDWNDLK